MKNKLANIFTQLAPYLIIIFYNLFLYNHNFKINGDEFEILFYEIIIMSSIICLLLFLEKALLKNHIKDNNLISLIQIATAAGYITNSFIRAILVFLIFYLIMNKSSENFIVFSKLFNTFCSFLLGILVIYNASLSIYKGTSYKDRVNIYNYDYKIDVDKSTASPNIYWIHVDEMTNFDFVEKYYDADLSEIRKYLKDNNFVTNERANFMGGNHTYLSLLSMYSPHFYDEYFKYYLDDLADKNINGGLTEYTCDYNDITNKRLDNELLKSLKRKDYTTIQINEFNQYSSLKTDYLFDIRENSIDDSYLYFEDLKEYKNNDYIKYIRSVRINTYTKLNENRFLGKKEKYDDIDISKYKYLNEIDNHEIKKIIKSLDLSKKIKSDKNFIFIDYNLSHLDWKFDKAGNYIDESKFRDLDSYGNNYEYSTKVLIDLIQYIKDNDNDPVIIVESDHGIHNKGIVEMKYYFKANNKEVEEMRHSTFSSYYIPKKYQNGDEKYLENPLNISRYIVNNYVGNNYEYIK